MTWPKPSPGDPLKIPASLQGRLIDLASGSAGPGVNRGGSRAVSPPPAWAGVMLAHNPTQSFIPAFGVAKVSGSAVDAGESLRQFLTRPVLDLEPATSADTGEVLTIAANRIEAGGLGPVYVSGIVPARVVVTDAGYGFAAPSDTAQWGLESTAGPGPIRLVWKQGGTGEVWALVMLSAAGAQGPARGTCRVLSNTFGSAAEADFDLLQYDVEILETGEVVANLGSLPTADDYRVLPGLVRHGDGALVRPARDDTFGVFDAVNDGQTTHRVFRLFDEAIVIEPCGGGG